MVLDHAALKHRRIDARIGHLIGDETDLAVVDQKMGAGLERGEDLGMRDRELGRIGR